MTIKVTYNYRPTKNTRPILDRAYEHIQSVPYKVSLRWLFYRVWQDGLYSQYAGRKNGKYQAYNTFRILMTRARKNFYEDWRPYTLSDDTRENIYRGHGYETETEAINAMKFESGPLSHWYSQDFYLECWFEARAMAQQFMHYTDGITLRPLGGQPSIAHLWDIAKDLENFYKIYGTPIVILYFGDCDTSGERIWETANRDVSEWCDVDFDFKFCGLTPEQAEQYELPDNPEKPDQYQWEALTDEQAREIITSNVNQKLRMRNISEARLRKKELDSWLGSFKKPIIKMWQDKNEDEDEDDTEDDDSNGDM